MCTVSFLPLADEGWVLTSNRDELKTRGTRPPEWDIFKGKNLFYPKDEQSGGTWIAMDDDGNIACLLNGGFENHVRRPNQTKSRGSIVKDYLVGSNSWMNDLGQVQPFTLIGLSKWGKLEEIVWDGDKIHANELLFKPHLWSSSTLYAEHAQKRRESWFQNWIKNHPMSPESILKFHTTKHSNRADDSDDIVMSRYPGPETVSISQAVCKQGRVFFTYKNLVNHATTNERV